MEDYSLGVPYGGAWREILNSDDERFGGSGVVNKPQKAVKKASHGQDYAIAIRLAPLAVQIFEGVDLPKKKPAKKAVKAKAKPARPATSSRKTDEKAAKPRAKKAKGKV